MKEYHIMTKDEIKQVIRAAHNKIYHPLYLGLDAAIDKLSYADRIEVRESFDDAKGGLPRNLFFDYKKQTWIE